MLKTVAYNKEIRSISRYTREHELLHEFHGSDKENMRFEYDSSLSAKRAYNALFAYISRNRMPLAMSWRENFLFIYKKEEKKNV